MKTFKTLAINLVCISLLFVSCQQEEIETVASTTPTELELANNYLEKSKNLLLFAALHIDHETFEIEGYIIDKFASLRRVDIRNGLAKHMGEAYLADNLMRVLHDKSEFVADLSVIDVAEAVKVSRRLITEETAQEQETLSTTKLYLAFERNIEHEQQESCGPGAYDSGPTHYQLLISANGHLEGKNTSKITEELLTWLQGIEEGEEN